MNLTILRYELYIHRKLTTMKKQNTIINSRGKKTHVKERKRNQSLVYGTVNIIMFVNKHNKVNRGERSNSNYASHILERE